MTRLSVRSFFGSLVLIVATTVEAAGPATVYVCSERAETSAAYAYNDTGDGYALAAYQDAKRASRLAEYAFQYDDLSAMQRIRDLELSAAKHAHDSYRYYGDPYALLTFYQARQAANVAALAE